RVVYGARLSLLVGAAVVVFSFAVGVTCGLVAGYYRRLDNVVMRVMDGLMAFPAIVLAIALMAALGASVVNVIVAIGGVYSARGAWLGARHPRDVLRGGGPRAGRRRHGSHGAPRDAQLSVARHRAGLVRVRGRRADRGRPLVFGRRRAAIRAVVGGDPGRGPP